MHSTPVVDGREASRLITQGRAGAADGSDVLGDGGSLDILACGFAAMSKPGLAVTGNMGKCVCGLASGKKVFVKVTQLCPTLCNPMDYSMPGSSVHGILQVRILEWVAVPFSRGSSQPRD